MALQTVPHKIRSKDEDDKTRPSGTPNSAAAFYDDIICEIGEMGFYQRRLSVLVFIATAGLGIWILSSIFTMGTPEFRCAIPEYSNDTYKVQNEAHGLALNVTIPYDAGKGRYSQCLRYYDNHRLNTTSRSNRTSLMKERCDSWVYSDEDYTSTLVSDLDLVCDRDIYISHANMMSMAGFMLGAVLCGSFADRFGRKKMFIIIYAMHVVVSIGSWWINSLPSLLVCRLLGTTTSFASFSCLYVLAVETVLPKRRVSSSYCAMFGWTAGLMVLALIAYFLRSWRNLHLAIESHKILVALIYPWLMLESPRWLMNKGRMSEARSVLEQIARINKSDFPEKLFSKACQAVHGKASREPEVSEISSFTVGNADEIVDSFRNGCLNQALNNKNSLPESVDDATTPESKNSQLLQFVRSPAMMFRIVVLTINWIVGSMVYFGITLNLARIIKGSIYMNVLIVAVLEFFTYVPCLIGLRLGGRRTIFCASVLLGGVSCLATILPEHIDIEGADVLHTVLSNVGKMGVGAALSINWLLTSELLPTPLRQSGLSFCSFVGRVGGIVSPYIVSLDRIVGGDLGQALPLTVFGTSAIVAGLLSLALPETAGRKLPESVREAESMRVRQRKDEETTTD